MSSVTHDEIFAVIAQASCGNTSARIEVTDYPDPPEPMARLAVALNVLLGDLDFRRREAEANLQDRLTTAEEALRRRDEFISIAAHELYTPLTSLRLVLDGLRSGTLAGDPAKLERALDLAQRQGEKLTQLVDGLLTVARSATPGGLPLRPEPVDLGALVREIAALCQPESARAGCELRIQTDEPIVGRWDRRSLDQVTMNLLGNAIKFGRGQPVDIVVSRRDDTARLSVADRGIGIPTDQLPRVFDRFERTVSAANYGGLGLGLFITRTLVAAHGGTIEVTSVPDEGTCFTVELPCAGPPETAATRTTGS